MDKHAKIKTNLKRFFYVIIVLSFLASTARCVILKMLDSPELDILSGEEITDEMQEIVEKRMDLHNAADIVYSFGTSGGVLAIMLYAYAKLKVNKYYINFKTKVIALSIYIGVATGFNFIVKILIPSTFLNTNVFFDFLVLSSNVLTYLAVFLIGEFWVRKQHKLEEVVEAKFR